MGELFNYHRLRQRWDNPRHGFTLVELIVVLVIIGILAAIAYVAYAALIKDSATKATKATAESVNREAIALAAFDGVAPSERVNDVLDDPGNGFQSVSNTATFGVVPAHLTHAFTLLAVQPTSLPTDGDTWEKGDITITYRTGGTYLFTNTDSGANNVIYEPSTVPGTATGVICATTDDTTCADGQTLASGGAGGDEGEGAGGEEEVVVPANIGETWTAQNASSVSDWQAVTYGAGTFVAVASAGTDRVMTSSDGATWMSHTAPTAVWQSVAYGADKFVTVGYDSVMTSLDGITWSTQNSIPVGYWNEVKYLNNQFVAVAWGGTNRIMTSPDGVTWTSQSSSAIELLSTAYGNGTYVAVGSSGTVSTSTDAATWSNANAGNSLNWSSVTFGDGKFVAVSSSGSSYGSTQRVMTSTDGITWTLQNAPESNPWPNQNQWQAVTFISGKFVAIGDSGAQRVMTSNDGVTWTAQESAADAPWQSVAYGDGRLVAVAYSGTNQVMTSP